MAGHQTMATLLGIFLIGMLVIDVQARYLPTRSNTDRLDKLRELLRDLVESEIGRAEFQQDMTSQYRPNEGKLYFKRDVAKQH